MAYTSGRCSSDVMFCIHNTLSCLCEWRGVSSGCVFSGDVKAAFDSCPVASVAKAMIASGIPAQCVACYFELQVDVRLVPTFEDIEMDRCK